MTLVSRLMQVEGEIVVFCRLGLIGVVDTTKIIFDFQSREIYKGMRA